MYIVDKSRMPDCQMRVVKLKKKVKKTKRMTMNKMKTRRMIKIKMKKLLKTRMDQQTWANEIIRKIDASLT